MPAAPEILYEEEQAGEEAGQNTQVEVSAPSVLLMEASTGTVLFEQDADTARPPASVTKIMTLLLIFDALADGKISLDDEVTTSEYAASMGGSQVFLEAGETQNVDTMIKCISVASANDACVAMAEYIAGNEEEFVRQMNERAKGLGMENTNFGTFSGSHGSSYFYDADPGDHTIQYVEKWSYDEPVKPGKTVSVTFTDLKTSSDTGDNSESFRTIAQGTWNLKFEMNFETLSAQLPSGQSFELNGMDGTINSVMVSPLGYRFEYTLNDKARFDEAPNGKSPDQHGQEWAKFDVPRSLNLSDGTVYDLSEGGGSIDTTGDKTICIRSGVFDEIIPLEKIVSVNIGGVDIPVQ